MAIYDVDANIGYYVIMELELIGGEGHLVAIEPSPDNIALLNHNLTLNNYRDVPVIESAVSDQPGSKFFLFVA